MKEDFLISFLSALVLRKESEMMASGRCVLRGSVGSARRARAFCRAVRRLAPEPLEYECVVVVVDGLGRVGAFKGGDG